MMLFWGITDRLDSRNQIKSPVASSQEKGYAARSPLTKRPSGPIPCEGRRLNCQPLLIVPRCSSFETSDSLVFLIHDNLAAIGRTSFTRRRSDQVALLTAPRDTVARVKEGCKPFSRSGDAADTVLSLAPARPQNMD